MAYQKNDDYIEVNERIQLFKAEYPEGCLRPLNPEQPYKIEQVGDKTLIVYMAAAYRTPDDPCPGVGVASEPFPGTTPYTKNSELMNAETSAWGRAIVALGVAANRKIASADEIRNREAEREQSGGNGGGQQRRAGGNGNGNGGAPKSISKKQYKELLLLCSAKGITTSVLERNLAQHRGYEGELEKMPAEYLESLTATLEKRADAERKINPLTGEVLDGEGDGASSDVGGERVDAQKITPAQLRKLAALLKGVPEERWRKELAELTDSLSSGTRVISSRKELTKSEAAAFIDHCEAEFLPFLRVEGVIE